MAKEPNAFEVDEALDDEELEEAPEGEEDEEPATAAPEPVEGEVESSLEELLAKREARPAEEEEDDDSVLAMGREERLEPLAVKVVPPSDKEFVCRNCHLVKHRSQLKDRNRMLCRDCA
jgi:Domain of unknown function (DUF4193)